jgi:hypothetical protein
VLGLPAETQSTMAEMRRVVLDQIKALNELSTIVARSHRAIDVAPAADTAVRASERPVSFQSRAGLTAEVRAGGPTPAARPAKPEPAPEPRPAAAAAEERPAPRREEPAAPAARKAAAPKQESERDELGSLGAISADITDMISGDQAFRLWTRHRAGERNVFSRELYPEDDRGTFDEIRRKHEAEPAFRRTVDRYVGEFERLLDSLPEGEAGERMRHTYLSSETGKVFLILAHASGRLD